MNDIFVALVNEGSRTGASFVARVFNFSDFRHAES